MINSQVVTCTGTKPIGLHKSLSIVTESILTVCKNEKLNY